MKAAVTSIINDAKLKQCKRLGVEAIIYYRIDKSIDYYQLTQQFKLISAFEDPQSANWYNFNLVAGKLERFCSKFNAFTNYKGYDLKAALHKDLFWSYLVPNALLFQVDKLKNKSSHFVFLDKRNSIKGKMALLKKVFFYRHAGYEICIDASISASNKVAFRMNDTYMYDLYGNLFDEIGSERVIPYQSVIDGFTDAVQPQMIQKFGRNWKANRKIKGALLNFVLKIKWLLGSFDDDFFNTILYNLNVLYNHVDAYEQLMQSGIKKLFVNAAENEGEGNVMCLVAKKYGAKVYNYMNGTKAKDPQNLHSYFDYWFMSDKVTQDIIYSYCNISREQLPVTGHLLQDIANAHQYSNTLKAINDKLEGKRIIALLTSKLYTDEKWDVYGCLKKYLDEHEDLVVVVRKHPTEGDSAIVEHQRIIQAPPFDISMQQKSLFDLFMKSELAISFSSMVSYQASWFKIPSLNYEVSEVSRLPFVDNHKIINVSTVEKLKDYLDLYLYQDRDIFKSEAINNVAKTIAEIVLK
jgi:hypothetical protein